MSDQAQKTLALISKVMARRKGLTSDQVPGSPPYSFWEEHEVILRFIAAVEVEIGMQFPDKLEDLEEA